MDWSEVLLWHTEARRTASTFIAGRHQAIRAWAEDKLPGHLQTLALPGRVELMREVIKPLVRELFAVLVDTDLPDRLVLDHVSQVFDKSIGNEEESTSQPAAPKRGRSLSIARGLSLRTLCELHLQQHPEDRRWLRSAALVLCCAPRALWSKAEEDFAAQLKGGLKAMTTGDSDLGQALSVAEPLSSSMIAR